MRGLDIDLWATAAIERVRRKQPCEDYREEVKREWPTDPRRAARQIAAHANAARGESILWVIGADEATGGIPGADPEELSAWWPRVRAHFDSEPPNLVNRNMPVDHVTVVALLFETESPPYVVKTGASPAEREVPWREGNSTRSATRYDLLRLLTAVSPAPDVAIHDGALILESSRPGCLDWKLALSLYAVPRNRNPVCFPFHDCSAVVAFEDRPVAFEGLAMGPHRPGSWPGVIPRGSLSGVRASPTEVTFDGPGMADLEAYGRTEAPRRPMSVSLLLTAAGSDLPVRASADLACDGEPGQDRWIVRREL